MSAWLYNEKQSTADKEHVCLFDHRQMKTLQVDLTGFAHSIHPNPAASKEVKFLNGCTAKRDAMAFILNRIRLMTFLWTWRGFLLCIRRDRLYATVYVSQQLDLLRQVYRYAGLWLFCVHVTRDGGMTKVFKHEKKKDREFLFLPKGPVFNGSCVWGAEKWSSIDAVLCSTRSNCQ